MSTNTWALAPVFAHRNTRYELLDLVESQTSSLTYRGRAFGRSRVMAVCLRVLRSGASPAEREALLCEARALGRLSHPAFPRMLDCGMYGATLFYAREDRETVSYADVYEALPWTAHLAVVIQVVDALRHAHGLVDAKGREVPVALRRINRESIGLSSNGQITITPPIDPAMALTAASARFDVVLNGALRRDVQALGVLLDDCLAVLEGQGRTDVPPSVVWAVRHACDLASGFGWTHPADGTKLIAQTLLETWDLRVAKRSLSWSLASVSDCQQDSRTLVRPAITSPVCASELPTCRVARSELDDEPSRPPMPVMVRPDLGRPRPRPNATMRSATFSSRGTTAIYPAPRTQRMSA